MRRAHAVLAVGVGLGLLVLALRGGQAPEVVHADPSARAPAALPPTFVKRAGPRPRTTGRTPHSQLDQTPSRAMHEAFTKRLFALPGVVEAPSRVSLPGARALFAAPDRAVGPPDAFIIQREFAHVHPPDDGSLHAAIPPEILDAVVAAGWAEAHPAAGHGIPTNIVMIYAPRDEGEIDVVMRIIEASRARAIF